MGTVKDWLKRGIAAVLVLALVGAITPAHAVVSGSVSSGVDLKDDRSADVEAAITTVKRLFGWTVTNGTTSDKADLWWADTRTLSASASEALDLTAVTNLFGTVTFAKVKAVFVIADRGNTNDVQVTRTATTGALLFMADGDGIALKPGAAFMFISPVTGFVVTDTSDDTLTITNSAGSTSVTYTIVIIGTSA